MLQACRLKTPSKIYRKFKVRPCSKMISTHVFPPAALQLSFWACVLRLTTRQICAVTAVTQGRQLLPRTVFLWAAVVPAGEAGSMPSLIARLSRPPLPRAVAKNLVIVVFRHHEDRRLRLVAERCSKKKQKQREGPPEVTHLPRSGRLINAQEPPNCRSPFEEGVTPFDCAA